MNRYQKFWRLWPQPSSQPLLDAKDMVALGLLPINPGPATFVFLLGLRIRRVVWVPTSLRQPVKSQPAHTPFHATILRLRELGLEQALDWANAEFSNTSKS
jgi:hypothetical protein